MVDGNSLDVFGIYIPITLTIQKNKINEIESRINSDKFELDWLSVYITTAALYGKLEILKRLIAFGLKKKLEINFMVKSHALTDAVVKNHVEVVKFLCRVGVDPTRMEDFAFRKACEMGHHEIVEFLLERSEVDINVLDNYAVRWACYYGHLETVRVLVKYGANVRVRNDNCIKIASESNFVDLVRYLAKLGCDVTKCKYDHQLEVIAYNIISRINKKKLRQICKDLIPVYYSPQYTGGKNAKKDLQSYCNEMSNFISRLKSV